MLDFKNWYLGTNLNFINSSQWIWLWIQTKFPTICKVALNIPLQFCIMYLFMWTDVFDIDNFKIKILVSSEEVPYPTVSNLFRYYFTSCCSLLIACIFLTTLEKVAEEFCHFNKSNSSFLDITEVLSPYIQALSTYTTEKYI